MSRKNYLFCDSVAGANATANLYSLIETAYANGIEPYRYLRHVFTELPKASDLSAVQMGIYQQGDTLPLTASEQGARALLLAGTPIQEPISQYGPLVMNTQKEIEQAIFDHNAGHLVA